ncbi:hypothetical protein NL676_001073 [Syzygium grande]|nr:hypothetical protein NL676_001073 [Syzygium grande]
MVISTKKNTRVARNGESHYRPRGGLYLGDACGIFEEDGAVSYIDEFNSPSLDTKLDEVCIHHFGWLIWFALQATIALVVNSPKSEVGDAGNAARKLLKSAEFDPLPSHRRGVNNPSAISRHRRRRRRRDHFHQIGSDSDYLNLSTGALSGGRGCGRGGLWGWNGPRRSEGSSRRPRRRSSRPSDSAEPAGSVARRFPLKQAATAGALALAGDTIAQVRERLRRKREEGSAGPSSPGSDIDGNALDALFLVPRFRLLDENTETRRADF